MILHATGFRVPGTLAVAVPCLAAGRLVVDVRLCDGIGVATDYLGECRSLVHTVPVLPVEVPHRIDFEVLRASFFAA